MDKDTVADRLLPDGHDNHFAPDKDGLISSIAVDDQVLSLDNTGHCCILWLVRL